MEREIKVWEGRVDDGICGGITNINDSWKTNMNIYYCRKFLKYIHAHT